MQDDRRAKPRLSISLDAVWDGATGKHAARVTNLSEGGCFLDTVGEVRRGEIVCFRMMLPDDDWLYIEGEVRHYTAGQGFGVQFVDLNEDQREKIQRMIAIAGGVGRPDLTADLVED